MSDEVIAEWALSNEAVVITFDEDFADLRRFRPGARPATVRLRVWPTTQDVIEAALARLLAQVSESTLMESSIVVDVAAFGFNPGSAHHSTGVHFSRGPLRSAGDNA